MSDFSLNNPANMIFWPLVLNLVVGCIVGACSKRVVWRLLIWFVFPLTVAIVAADPQDLFSESRESAGLSLIVFFGFATFGLLACGLGVLTGYFLRRAIASK